MAAADGWPKAKAATAVNREQSAQKLDGTGDNNTVFGRTLYVVELISVGAFGGSSRKSHNPKTRKTVKNRR